MTLKRVSERLLQEGAAGMAGFSTTLATQGAGIRTVARTAAQSGLNLGDLCEPVPDPEDPSLSPGESFAARIDPEVTGLTEKMKGLSQAEKQKAVMRLVTQKLDEAGLELDSPIRRYVRMLYTQSYVQLGKARSVSELRVRGNAARRMAESVEISGEIEQAYAEMRRRILLCTWPPNLSSAANIEAELMALSYCNEAVLSVKGIVSQNWFEAQIIEDPSSAEDDFFGSPIKPTSEASREAVAFATYWAASNFVDPLPSNYRRRFDVWCDAEHLQIPDSGFGGIWLRSNFAKIEVGHKFAAALALTDVPDDVEVSAPWEAWSLVIPPGLFVRLVAGKELEISRALCAGTEIRYLLGSKGEIHQVFDKKILEDRKGAPESPTMHALRSLVKGVCLALSEPDEYKRESTSKASKSRREGGAPDLNQARFMLSASVVVDLRDHLKAVLRGEKKTRDGGRINFQFLVRGHWKNQSHGPRHSLRKRIWIQPFWKGDEHARVLLRNYTVKDEQVASDPGVEPHR